VIPAYERLATLGDAVQSVVTSDPSRCEVVVVDDASPMPLEGRLPPYNSSGVAVRVFRLSRNCGPQTARNLGIRRSRYRYVALLDSDEVFLPEKVDTVMRELQTRPVDLLFHSVIGHERYAAIGRLWTERLKRAVPFDWLVCFLNPVPTSSLVFLRAGRLGVPTLRHCEDYSFVLRYVCKNTKVTFLPEALARIHRPAGAPGGLSGDLRSMRKGEFTAKRVLLKTGQPRDWCRYAAGLISGSTRLAADVLRCRY
jgi:glycosyltransferase involved in cell wall biosynthesis